MFDSLFLKLYWNQQNTHSLNRSDIKKKISLNISTGFHIDSWLKAMVFFSLNIFHWTYLGPEHVTISRIQKLK